ncbi:acyl-ACP--UDP-N-acetylglucosamine O-acyltransferase [Balneatrix alpica]|uniref:Acyl-[acyl-carrier-protein]--UDP-N-acetylglucosamine O-acyltransferase n=1 Tax=Balneatrix alpica TaxID=75684 RepID=A0ABV5ZEF1_9GAMM|nr:acyl-ACP--UDP-N-acetylglucosamine O-acyltransferase [Balneatrix alpica]
MIHPLAIVDDRAKLAANVEVGPWSYIGPDVEIDSGTVVASHVVIKGPCRIGKHNQIFQFATVGEACQDKKYKGEPTRLEIGDYNVIREGCTLHRGTVQDQGVTRIGSHNLLMAYVHVAHDCVVGDHTIIANNAALAGHVHVGDWAILGGLTGVHQFCHIGAHAMLGAGSVVLKDVPAYIMANGNTAKPHGINVEGLKRRGFSAEAISVLRQAYKVIYRQGLTVEQALARLQPQLTDTPELGLLLDSLRLSSRGIVR